MSELDKVTSPDVSMTPGLSVGASNYTPGSLLKVRTL